MRLKELNQEEIFQVNSLKWRHKILVGKDSNGHPVFTNGLTDFENDMTRVLALPPSLDDWLVLDLGTSDGAVAFECEERGAVVVPFDLIPQPGFELAAWLLGSRMVTPLLRDVQSEGYPFLEPHFDLILCLGLIYHVQNPFRVFELMRRGVEKDGLVLIESEIVPPDESNGASWTLKLMYNNDPTNYWFPTEAGLIETSRLFGFKAERKWSNESGRRMTFELHPI